MRHLAKDEIERVLSRGASPAEASYLFSHILNCTVCLGEAERVLDGGIQTSGKAGNLLRLYLDFEQENVVEMLLADALWSEMKGLSAKVQKDRIATTSICKTASFARLLLNELCTAKAWDESERLAALVATSIHAMDAKEYPLRLKNDLRGEVMIELANSRRRAAEWKRAEEALQRAGAFLAQGSGARTLRARLLSVSGSFEADRGQLDVALATFESCMAMYEEVGQDALVAKTLLKAANALSEPDPRRGLLLLDRAEPKFLAGDPLIANARLLRVDCLIWTGELREAAHRLMYCDRPNEGRMQIRYRFIGARLLHSLGHKKEAERLFQDVITDDLDSALFKDALLDLLYLLKVHLADGEMSKALAVCRRALGETVLADFSHEQLKSVWQQVLNAVEVEAISPETFPALKHYMSLHWRHPAPHAPSLVRVR